MSLSQMIVYYLGCGYFGVALGAPNSFWHFFKQCTVTVWACIGYYVALYYLFNSAWYKGVEKAVGFSLGF